MKAVLYTSAAQRSLRKLPAGVREQVEAALRRYAETELGDVTALKGSDALRLRSGDYRVVFVETAAAVEARKVGHRRDVYR